MKYKTKPELKRMRFKLTFLSLFFLLLPNTLFAQGLPINGAAAAIKNVQEITAQHKDHLDQAQENMEAPAQENNDLKNQENAAKDKISNILLGKKADSLMFSEEEGKNINRAIESYKSNEAYSIDDHQGSSDGDVMSESDRLKMEEEERNKNAKSYIYLASLLYMNPNEWIIWINDKKISSRNNDEENEFFIKSINKGGAEIVWKIGLTKWRIISRAKPEDPAPETNEENKVEVSFKLKPNQTFILTTNEIVEGRP